MLVKGTFKMFQIINHPNTTWEFIEQRRYHVGASTKFKLKLWQFQQIARVSCILYMISNLKVILEIRTYASTQTFLYKYQSVNFIQKSGDVTDSFEFTIFNAR